MYTVSLETISYALVDDCSGTLLYICANKNILISYYIHIIILIHTEALLVHIFYTEYNAFWKHKLLKSSEIDSMT